MSVRDGVGDIGNVDIVSGVSNFNGVVHTEIATNFRLFSLLLNNKKRLFYRQFC